MIKIQEDDFEKIKNTSFVENTEIMFHQSSEDRKLTMMLFRIMDAIKDGTPLPKGHGKLIDAEELKKNNEEYIIQDPTDSEENTRNIIVGWINEDIANAPTIIDADKAESEGEE